jgi:predicted Zn-dependent protease
LSRLAALIIALLAAAPVLAQREPVALPEIGSSADSILSPQQERQYGTQMLRQLRGAGMVLEDPEIAEYIATLGYRVVAHSEKPEQPFTFFVVRSPQINAFAAPGGVVGTNAGLIVTAETESELAAVLAHEVAHVTQRHIVRAYERMQKVSLPVALAMLGAVIAAQNSNSGSEAAEAAIVGGQALLQQQQINFTRDNEYEADRIGIQTLARAGFEPQAMATFFWRMGRATRSNSASSMPEFLRTHPITAARVSEAKARADAMARHDGPEKAMLDDDSLITLAPTARDLLLPRDRLGEATAGARVDRHEQFLMFRERARVLGGWPASELVQFYQRSLEQAGDAPPLAWRYGLALSLRHSNQPDEAITLLERLVGERPDLPSLALALADAEAAAGHREIAIGRLAELARRHRGNRTVAIAYADQLIATGDPARARAAMDLLRPLVTQSWDDALLQLSFARAAQLAGDEVRSGEAHAEVALLNGRYDDAVGQLENLLLRSDVDYYQRARIEARIAELTPLALEQRRRMLTGTS